MSATPLPDLSHGAQVIRFGGAVFISARFHAMEFNYEFDCFLVHDIKSFTFRHLIASPGRFGIHHGPAVPGPKDKPSEGQ